MGISFRRFDIHQWPMYGKRASDMYGYKDLALGYTKCEIKMTHIVFFPLEVFGTGGPGLDLDRRAALRVG